MRSIHKLNRKRERSRSYIREAEEKTENRHLLKDTSEAGRNSTVSLKEENRR